MRSFLGVSAFDPEDPACRAEAAGSGRDCLLEEAHPGSKSKAATPQPRAPQSEIDWTKKAGWKFENWQWFGLLITCDLDLTRRHAPGRAFIRRYGPCTGQMNLPSFLQDQPDGVVLS